MGKGKGLVQNPTASHKFMKITLELKGCIKVGHVHAHKSPLPGSEGEWNHQGDLWVCSLQVATWVHEMRGLGGAAAIQTCQELLNVSKRQRLQAATGKIPQGEGSHIAGKCVTLEQGHLCSGP